MCLLCHGFSLNNVCKDPALQALVISLQMKSLKASKCNQSNVTECLDAIKCRFNVKLDAVEPAAVNTYSVVGTIQIIQFEELLSFFLNALYKV